MKCERGTTMPLIIGFASILLALTFALTEVLTLRLSQDRTLSDARYAATALVRQSSQESFVRGLDYGEVVSRLVPEAVEVSAVSIDGKTIRVRLCENWLSPFGIHPKATTCDEALSRLSSQPLPVG